MSHVKKEEPDQPDLGAPSQDFRLSAPPESWTAGKRFNVLKFGHASAVSPAKWKQPLKLNRRTEAALRRMEEGDTAAGEAAEAEIRRKPFHRKTNRVVQSEESKATLQMRREERHPWLLEDASSSTSARAQRWTGRLEGAVGSGTDSARATKSHYILLVLDQATNDFKVIPAHRIYNFVKRPNRTVLDAEQADLEFARRSRNFWSMHARNDSQSPSARVKVEPVESHRLLGRAVKKESDTLREQLRGQRKMKAKFDRDLFGSDDEDKKKRLDEDEQDFDEFDFEEDVQDDEEGAGMEADDANDEEENRQNEEKRKRELRAANRSDDEPEDSDRDRKELDSAGKKAKKLMRQMGRTEYESDEDPDERDPYAPEKDSSDDDPSRPGQRTSAKLSRSAKRKGQTSARPSLPNSRAGSPSPSLNAGSAAIARRATSPRPLTPRGNSPGPSKRKAEDGNRNSTSKRARTATPVGSDISDTDIIEFLRKSKGQMVPIVEVLKYAKKVLGFDVKGRLAELQAMLDRVGQRDTGGVMLRPELE